MTAGYAWVQVPTLEMTDPFPDYYAVQLPFYLTCDIYEIPNERNPLNWWLACFSHKVLDNDKLIPYIAAVAHIPTVALLAFRWTGSAAVGVVASAALIANPYFYLFDDSAVYSQVWSFFLILSVLLLYSKPAASPFSFFLAVATKVYAVAFIPMYIYHILSCPIKGKRWLLLLVGILIAVSYLIASELGVGSQIGFYPERFEDGLINTWGNIWIVAPYILIFIIINYMIRGKPVSKTGINSFIGERAVLLWIGWIITTIPLLHLFTESQVMFGYRLVPLGVFMSIYIGIVINNIALKVMRTPHNFFKYQSKVD